MLLLPIKWKIVVLEKPDRILNPTIQVQAWQENKLEGQCTNWNNVGEEYIKNK